MKLGIRFFVMIVVIFGVSCTDKQQNRVCTTVFQKVTMRFKNVAGDYVTVMNFKVVVERTGLVLSTDNELNITYYEVASDSDRQKLSNTGDIVIVTATNPSNGNPIAATFKIAGGECHIEKISGPEEVTIN